MFKENYKEAIKEIRTPHALLEDTLSKMGKETGTKRNPLRRPLYGAAAAVLVILISVSLSASPTRMTYAISTPEYPERTAFDDASRSPGRRERIDPAFLSGLEEFSLRSASLLLDGQDVRKNLLFSPISLYIALSMAAESAAGQTREEVLDALHVDSMDLVRSETGKLFRKLYTDNEIGKLSLGSSLWLNQDAAFEKDLLETLGRDYYVHSFHLDFEDPKSSRTVSEWVSGQTGGKLGTSPSDFSFSKEDVLSLLSTIYFKDEWQDRFDPSKTRPDAFHLGDGTAVTTDFMNLTYFSHPFARRGHYTVSALNMKNQRQMVFILPDEETTIEELLEDSSFLKDALGALDSEDASMGEVVFQVPKFNFTSSLALRDMAEAMGIAQLFTPSADFSPLSPTRPLFVSGISQNATISIDEKGVEAAAFTEIRWVGSAPPAGRAEMVLDRPFLFAITGMDGAPLFVGTLNDPSK